MGELKRAKFRVWLRNCFGWPPLLSPWMRQMLWHWGSAIFTLSRLKPGCKERLLRPEQTRTAADNRHDQTRNQDCSFHRTGLPSGRENLCSIRVNISIRLEKRKLTRLARILWS